MQGCPLCGMRLPPGPVLDAHIAGELDDLDRAEWTNAATRGDGTNDAAGGNTATMHQHGARCGLDKDQRCTSAAAQTSTEGARGAARALTPVPEVKQRPHGASSAASGRRNRNSATTQQLGLTGSVRSGRRRQPRDASAVRLNATGLMQALGNATCDS